MRQKTWIKLAFGSCKGSTPVIIICTTLIIIVISAFLADIGYASVERYIIAKTADMVAMKGADTVIYGRDAAVSVMKAAAVKEVNDLNEMDVKVSPDNNEISVVVGKPFDYIFLKFIGFSKKQLTAKAVAKLSNISSFKGIRPFAVERQKFIYDKEMELSLREPGKAGFNTLSLGTGDFKSNTVLGCDYVLNAGSGVYTSEVGMEEIKENIEMFLNKIRGKTGNAVGIKIQDDSGVIVLPVVEKLELTAGKVMKIIGFTAFLMESVIIDNKRLLIKGKFIRGTVKSSTSDAVDDFGLLGVRLFH